MDETVQQVLSAAGAQGLTEDDVRAGLDYVQALCTNPFIHLMTSYVREQYDRVSQAGRQSSDQIATANGLLADLQTLSQKSPNTAGVPIQLDGIEDPYFIQFICTSRRKDLQIYVPEGRRDVTEAYTKLEESAAALWPRLKTEYARMVRRVCRFLNVGDLSVTKTGRTIELAPGYDTVMCVYSSFVALKDDSSKGIKKNDRYQMRGTNPKHAKSTHVDAPVDPPAPAESAPIEPSPPNTE